VKILALLLLLSALPAHPQQSPEIFARSCAGCNGESARGTAKVPGLAMNSRVAEHSVDQLSKFLERSNIAAGMPAFADLPVADRRALANYLLNLNVGLVIRLVEVAEATPKVTWGSPRPGDG
jgi:mono/diheme cytochrome c family protein